MATFNFSALADGQAISFNPNTDVLNFDQSVISAADVRAVAEGTGTRITVVSGNFAGKDILLQNTTPLQLATSNTTFANGSQMLLGDNSVAQNDNLANTLTGTAGNDLLQGFGGADTMNGGLGNDTYIVSTGDVISDSGGIDTVVSDVSWTLGADFENLTLTGTTRADAAGNNLANVITGSDAANFINGRAGNDTIVGMGGNDSIDMSTGGTGNIGNRFIDGGAGIDQVDYDGYAQSAIVVNLGAQTATGGSLNGGGSATLISIERVIAGAFNDNLTGSSGDDFLDGRGGNDALSGGGGSDTLAGGAGDDLLRGDGNDTLAGGTGADNFLFASAPGALTSGVIADFTSASDKVLLDGNVFSAVGAAGSFAAGDARFFAAPGATSGHDADDRIIYNTTTGQLFYDADGSGAGAPQLITTLNGAPALAATDIAVVNGTPGAAITGTAGNDSIMGTTGNDTIDAGAGNDTVNGSSGNDSIQGGAGNDSIFGAEGVDTMLGGDGNDTINGDNASFGETDVDIEALDGGLGDDLFIVDNAADVVTDAGGLDTVRAVNVSWTLGAGFENLQMFNAELSNPGVEGHPSPRLDGIGNELNNLLDASGGSGVFMDGRAGNDTLLGSHAVGIDTLLGGDGNDSIDGGEHSDSIDGGTGDDTLLGGAGFWEDTLLGGAGNDVLSGGEDHDTLTGGAGADTFLFANAPGAVSADSITDFATGVDKISLDGNFHPNIGASGNFTQGDARFFSGFGATSGHDADDRVIYDFSTGNVWYDADGNGAGASQLIATVQPGINLAATDITVVNGSAGPTSVQGTEGNDSLADTAGDDVIDAKGGSDFIHSSTGNDTILGGTGDDLIQISASSYGNDLIDGGAGFDQLGLSGNDAQSGVVVDMVAGTITGGHAGGAGSAKFVNIEAVGGTQLDDRLIGNDSGVFLEAGPGNDTVIGGAGNDGLVGNSDDDSLVGGAGNDTLGDRHDDSPGSDTMDGGLGDDTYYVKHSTDTLVDAGGVDTIEVQGISWTLGAGFENLVFYNLANDNGYRGLSGTGNDLNNTIDAHQGADGIVARGLGGNDSIVGTFYSDTLDGGAGNDTLDGLEASPFKGSNGEPGFDTYVFSAAPGAANADLVRDFTPNTDKIRLDGNSHTNIGVSGNFVANDGRFFAAAGASSGHDADDRVIYDTTAGKLWYDADGSGAGAAQLIATVLGAPALAATDIAVDNGTPAGPIQGTAGDDSLTGTLGDDTIDGLAGNDTIDGNGGGDVLIGGAGNDLLVGGPFNADGRDLLVGDRYLGGDGDDTMDGFQLHTAPGVFDTMDGGLGNDFYRIDQTGDVLTDAGGVDTVEARDIDWTLGAGFENLRIANDVSESFHIGVGNELANQMSISWGGSRLEGLGGDDTLSGGFVGSSELFGGDGNDLIFSGNGAGPNLLDGGAGNDTLSSGGTSDSLFGGDGLDSLDGGSGNDTLDGGAGIDTMAGSFDDDTYFVTAGDVLSDFGGIDTIVSGVSWTLGADFENLTFTGTASLQAEGNNLDNVITGNAGDNFVNSRAGNDTILAGAGNDTIDMSTGGTDSPGNKMVDGGAGFDMVDYDGYAKSALVANLGAGTVSGGGVGGVGSATLVSIERFAGGAFNDSIIGSSVAERLEGRGGNDTIAGGAGNDSLWGGAGNDTFVFNTAPSTSNVDSIGDFVSATDKLALDDAVFTAIGGLGNFAAGDARFFAGAGATAGHDANDRIVYNTTTGALYYDADGSGAGAAQQIATISGHPAVAATDIAVI